MITESFEKFGTKITLKMLSPAHLHNTFEVEEDFTQEEIKHYSEMQELAKKYDKAMAACQKASK